MQLFGSRLMASRRAVVEAALCVIVQSTQCAAAPRNEGRADPAVLGCACKWAGSCTGSAWSA